MSVDIKPAIYADCVDYIGSLGVANAPKTIKTCMAMSEKCWVGLVDGELACLWGLIPPTIMSEQAYLWLVVTPLVEDHKFVFVRHSQIMVKRMLEEYPRIVGHTAISNDRGIRWLKWLGATFSEPKGALMPFVIRRKADG